MEWIRSRKLSRTIITVLLLTITAWLIPAGLMAEKAEAAVILKNPTIVEDSSMTVGQKVTWDCVWFGSYPQSEVVCETDSDAITNLEAMNADYGVEYSKVSESTWNSIVNASYDSNGDASVEGNKYRRIKKNDATRSDTSMYRWKDADTYHYFKYDPIKWRVLNVNETEAFLLADEGLDNQKYNTYNITSMTWEKSTIRSWLNGYDSSVNTCGEDYSGKSFINSAFTSSELSAIKITNVVNADNIKWDTKGGNDTQDKIFLLSESEVYNTSEAESYGFEKSRSAYDNSRRSKSSIFAKAMGASARIGDSYAGNCLWWLRSPGYYNSYAAVVDDVGEVYNGTKCDVSTAWCAVRPAMYLDLSYSELYSYAGTVCSDGTSNTLPVINAADKTYCIDSDIDYTMDVTASDAEDGNLTSDIQVDSSQVDTSKAGKYVVTYTVTDKQGGTCQVDMHVTIENHSFDEGVITKEPSCTEKGEMIYTCIKCKTTKTKEIAALGHSYSDEFTVDKEPTCTEVGSKSKHCENKNCSAASEVTEIPEINHTEGDKVEKKEATFFHDGTAVVKCSVCNEIIKEETLYYDGNMMRIYGDNRYLTSNAVTDNLKQSLGVDKFENIIVASGADYPDALAGSYLAKVKNAPVMLVGKDADTEADVKQYISNNLKAGGTVYLLGGTGVVTSRFETGVNKLKDSDGNAVNVERLGGASRYETNIAILKAAGISADAKDAEDLLVCTGEGFADRLSASAVGKPILLVAKAGLNSTQKNYLKSIGVNDVYLIGGTGVVSESI